MGQRITVRIYVAERWWLRPYLCALACMCQLTGMSPVPSKLYRMLHRGVVIKHELVR